MSALPLHSRVTVDVARELDYASERATAAIRRRLAEAGVVSAESLAWSLSRALLVWRPGLDALDLVQSSARVDEATARAVVEGWCVGVDEHVRTLDHLALRYGRYEPAGAKVERQARAIEQHAAALRAVMDETEAGPTCADCGEPAGETDDEQPQCLDCHVGEIEADYAAAERWEEGDF